MIALLISYSSIYIPPDKYWQPSFFGLAYPIILSVNAAFILLWILVKPKFLLMSLITIFVGWGIFNRYIQLKGKKSDDTQIKVVSYNVKYFNANGAKSQKQTADSIISFLDDLNADIICLQEARLRKNEIFNLPTTVKNLKSINHYQYARSSTTYGSVTMTRYPIVNMGEIRFEGSRNMAIYTDVLIGKDTTRIINVHLQSLHIDPSKYDIIESPNLSEEKDIEQVKEVGSKYKRAVQLRAKQVREIRKYIDDWPHKVLICGDFNDIPTSYSYQTLKGNLLDAFVESGIGIGRTYDGNLPSMRIDNIFISKDFEAYNFQTIDQQLSDHLPISCELGIE